MARLSRLLLKEELAEVINEALDEIAEFPGTMEEEEETQHVTDRVFAFLTEHDSEERDLYTEGDENDS